MEYVAEPTTESAPIEKIKSMQIELAVFEGPIANITWVKVVF